MHYKKSDLIIGNTLIVAFVLILLIVIFSIITVVKTFTPESKNVIVESETFFEVNDTFAPTIYTIPDQCDLAVVDCK